MRERLPRLVFQLKGLDLIPPERDVSEFGYLPTGKLYKGQDASTHERNYKNPEHDCQRAGVSRVVTINSGVVTLSDVTIRNGRAEGLSFYDVLGGDIYNNGELTINESTVSANIAFSPSNSFLASGGGIYNRAKLTINNSTISANNAGCGRMSCSSFGGGILNVGSLFINNSSLVGNIAWAHYAFSQGGPSTTTSTSPGS